MIFDNKGKQKKINHLNINEYIKKLKYSNISKYKKLKPNLKNCPKIDYKKIIEDSYKMKNKSLSKSNKKVNKIKKVEIWKNSNNNNSLKLKKRINSICDDLIKSIEPISNRNNKFNSNKKEINLINNKNNNTYIKRNNLLNSYEVSLKKINQSKEENNSINLKRKKAKEKILNAIDDIRKYFEDIY